MSSSEDAPKFQNRLSASEIAKKINEEENQRKKKKSEEKSKVSSKKTEWKWKRTAIKTKPTEDESQKSLTPPSQKTLVLNPVSSFLPPTPSESENSSRYHSRNSRRKPSRDPPEPEELDEKKCLENRNYSISVPMENILEVTVKIDPEEKILEDKILILHEGKKLIPKETKILKTFVFETDGISRDFEIKFL